MNILDFQRRVYAEANRWSQDHAHCAGRKRGKGCPEIIWDKKPTTLLLGVEVYRDLLRAAGSFDPILTFGGLHIVVAHPNPSSYVGMDGWRVLG